MKFVVQMVFELDDAVVPPTKEELKLYLKAAINYDDNMIKDGWFVTLASEDEMQNVFKTPTKE